MNRSFRLMMIVIGLSVIFSGCNFADLFAKFASSDIEMGAREEYNQAKIIEAKQKTIEQKKATFTDTVELKNVNDTTSFVAYAFRKSSGNTTQIDIEAMLPSPDRQVYEVWLRGNGQEIIDLGPLKYNQTDDYSLTFTTDKDINNKTSLIISRESVLDDKPETIIMTGAFSASTVPSAK